MATPATALTGVIGDSILVRSHQVDAYGGASNSTVVWTTSSAAVATVQNVYNSNNAIISYVSAGTTTITATMGSVTATFSVTVIAAATNPGKQLVVDADQSFVPSNRTIQTKIP